MAVLLKSETAGTGAGCLLSMWAKALPHLAIFFKSCPLELKPILDFIEDVSFVVPVLFVHNCGLQKKE